ncbi:kinase-like domain-containing protein [Chlamydoabsidia padenii]|nr:kinase-like domain-containing protein [Chlamydoabsidia padenii]
MCKLVERIRLIFRKAPKVVIEKKKPLNEHTDEYPPDLEQHYKVTKKILGTGSFAVVKECIHRHSGQPFALKIIQKNAIADILKQVRHPHIVSMHALYESPTAVYIVTDLASGGELFQQLLSKGAFTEKDASHLVSQILEGVAYLHNHDLLFQTPGDHANLMITDFGLSKILKNQDDILMTSCGTPGYVAHEVLEQKGYGKPVDLWSIGVITFILLVGYTPFYGADQAELFSCIIKGEYSFDEEYWGDISDSAKNFIDGLLTYDPDQRLTAEQALEHPWITASLAYNNIPPNLITNVRRGFSTRPSFRSTLDTLDQCNVIERNQPTINDTTKDLDVGNKPSRKRLFGKHLKTLLESRIV